MRLRPDVIIFAVLLAGSAFAVVSQLDDRKPAWAPPPIGAKVEEFRLRDVTLGDRSLAELSKDKKATVLYFWMVSCPCVDALEGRMRKIVEKYEPLGVSFLGVVGDPSDTVDQVKEKMGTIRATSYRVLLDPKQEVVRSAGVRTATEVVVLDAQHRIRYRGSLDDNLVKPKVDYLSPALDAVLAGRAPTPSETAPYGCPLPGFEGLCAFE